MLAILVLAAAASGRGLLGLPRRWAVAWRRSPGDLRPPAVVSGQNTSLALLLVVAARGGAGRPAGRAGGGARGPARLQAAAGRAARPGCWCCARAGRRSSVLPRRDRACTTWRASSRPAATWRGRPTGSTRSAVHHRRLPRQRLAGQSACRPLGTRLELVTGRALAGAGRVRRRRRDRALAASRLCAGCRHSRRSPWPARSGWSSARTRGSTTRRCSCRRWRSSRGRVGDAGLAVAGSLAACRWPTRSRLTWPLGGFVGITLVPLLVVCHRPFVLCVRDRER